jgi:signal transduction histidine kinase
MPVVSLDPGRMAQVIGNLISNAIQYTPNGGHIQVAAGREDRQVWISVEDTGIGITPEERQKIFEPLYRGPRARRFPQGMGLGLSIAIEIVRLHGGDLQVSSEVGYGSRFTVYLPVNIS